MASTTATTPGSSSMARRPMIQDGLDGREHVINCDTHSDMRELLCGFVACSVLLQLGMIHSF